jgi:type IV pilus assembly protein PilB
VKLPMTNNSQANIDVDEMGSDALRKKAASLKVAFLEKIPRDIHPSVVNIIPSEVAEKHGLAAFEKKGNVLKVGMIDPQNINALNVLRFIAEKEKLEVEVYLVSDEMQREILRSGVGPTEMVNEAVQSYKDDFVLDEASGSKDDDRKKTEQILKDAPVTKLVQVLISHAIEGHASDIHIEPMDHDYRVRFRVDGILHISLIFPKEIGPAVVSRIKILSNLKIEEKRKPQDGRFRLNIDGKDVDFRVSTLPVLLGEKVVMRILDKEEGLADLETLGLMGSSLENIKEAIKESFGMILLTGPTGSGKSTTLYALLKILNREERNIVTLEDPIEYNLEGLNQSQIKPEIGYTFASGLRTVLRQDPNVIMVGEIRDSETAELAVHAALTGHLMFSTLHTNTAIGAIPRLIDMGIEQFLLASSLRMVMAQRLVRKICPECREKKKISVAIKNRILEEIKNVSDGELKKYGIESRDDFSFYHSKGCERCNDTGFMGRVALYEAVPINEKIKDIIVENRGSESLIKAESERAGFLSMKQDGILKALLGETTIEEVERVSGRELDLADEEI